MLGSIAGTGATGSGLLATTASVVKIKLATDAAFCRAERLTLNWVDDSLFNHVDPSPVAALKPVPSSAFFKRSITIEPSNPALWAI